LHHLNAGVGSDFRPEHFEHEAVYAEPVAAELARSLKYPNHSRFVRRSGG
jgi:uncharacterized SAM-dependent methyltransferase